MHRNFQIKAHNLRIIILRHRSQLSIERQISHSLDLSGPELLQILWCLISRRHCLWRHDCSHQRYFLVVPVSSRFTKTKNIVHRLAAYICINKMTARSQFEFLLSDISKHVFLNHKFLDGSTISTNLSPYLYRVSHCIHSILAINLKNCSSILCKRSERGNRPRQQHTNK